MNKLFRPVTGQDVICIRNRSDQDGMWLSLSTRLDSIENILDEAVGALGWQKKFKRNKCVLAICDNENKEWVVREEPCTGRSFEEGFRIVAESFGIGRELCSVKPFYIPYEKLGTTREEEFGLGGFNTDSLIVTDLACEEGSVSEFRLFRSDLVLIGQYSGGKFETDIAGRVEWRMSERETEMPSESDKPIEETHEDDSDTFDAEEFPWDPGSDTEDASSLVEDIRKELKRTGVSKTSLLKFYGVSAFEEMSYEQCDECLRRLQAKSDAKR